ncbi:cytochrome p450 [Moniliophthora roreri MCA 2997]|uniref:Cytochrome p450 n=2 Tax=Moniliophthora roreri TaxID=221103 RepID=V2XFR3_MONRO|nr:cytochrome p450 [Moniliophthora roreri MCA 2997]
MISLLGLLLTGFGVYVVARRLSQLTPESINNLLTPKGKSSLIWGHQMEMFKQKHSDTCVKWVRELGTIFRIKAALFQPDLVFIADNTAAQYIFQNAYTYVKAPVFRPLIQKLLGRGIVWAEGEEHKYQRKLLAPAFTPNAVKGMADDVFSSVEKLTNRLRAEIANREKDSIVNIAPLASACTLDIIGRVGFGYDFGGGQSREAKAIADSWHRDVELSHSFGGFLAPILLNIMPWITKLPIPALQAESVAKRITVLLANQMLQEHRAGQGRDILSLLISGQAEESGKGARMEKEILLENISTLLMVGHETSAGTVIFTLFELAQNPKAQAKLRQEIRQAGTLTHDTILNLEYLDAVVREGLRLYPPSPRTERVSLCDDVIPLGKPILTQDGTYIRSLPVKAGQSFHISFTAMNVNPEVWGTDAHEFKPERWLTPGAMPSDLPHGPWANVASFCDGTRGCIGWRLAVLELKAMIGCLVRDFDFSDSGHKVDLYVSPTLQPFVNGEGGMMPLRISLAPEA